MNLVLASVKESIINQLNYLIHNTGDAMVYVELLGWDEQLGHTHSHIHVLDEDEWRSGGYVHQYVPATEALERARQTLVVYEDYE